jgi:hypothetical protein
MENTKKHSKKKHDILRLFGEGSIEKIKNHETTKKNKTIQKIQKIQNYRPHGTPCHKSPDMRCIVLDETEAQ